MIALKGDLNFGSYVTFLVHLLKKGPYTFERGPSLFFSYPVFLPLTEDTHTRNIYGNRGLNRYTRTCM